MNQHRVHPRAGGIGSVWMTAATHGAAAHGNLRSQFDSSRGAAAHGVDPDTRLAKVRARRIRARNRDLGDESFDRGRCIRAHGGDYPVMNKARSLAGRERDRRQGRCQIRVTVPGDRLCIRARAFSFGVQGIRSRGNPLRGTEVALRHSHLCEEILHRGGICWQRFSTETQLEASNECWRQPLTRER